MSLVEKQIIINKLALPKEIINIIKEYAFHEIKKISKKDERYNLLSTIPCREYIPEAGIGYVYLKITDDKDYCFIYSNTLIQIFTLKYDNINAAYLTDSSIIFEI